jgi:hypothetical protein
MGNVTHGVASVSGLASEANQTTIIDNQDNLLAEVNKIVGFEIGDYDYIEITYVASGNGVGEIETVTYKTGGSGGTAVATLTLTYDASDNLSTITKS